ncbi:MAG: hypothetical protein RL300_1133 [Pseudomonadota bacterium]
MNTRWLVRFCLAHGRGPAAPVVAGAHRLFIAARTFAVAALVAACAGCTAPPPWPAPTSDGSESPASTTSCPGIAGTYLNAATAGSPCDVIDAKACASLTFYFFSDHVPEASGVSNFPTSPDDWPSGTHVQIEQPTVDVLRIMAERKSNAGKAEILASKELDRQRGEFECQENTIRLRPKVQHDAQLWMGRRTNKEYLTVSVNQEALVVESRRQYETYLLWFVGGTMREEQSWHRWERVK